MLSFSDHGKESETTSNAAKPRKIKHHVDSLMINKTQVRRRSLNDREESSGSPSMKSVESSPSLMKTAKDALNQAYLNQIPHIEIDTILTPRRKSADHLSKA